MSAMGGKRTLELAETPLVKPACDPWRDSIERSPAVFRFIKRARKRGMRSRREHDGSTSYQDMRAPLGPRELKRQPDEPNSIPIDPNRVNKKDQCCWNLDLVGSEVGCSHHEKRKFPSASHHRARACLMDRTCSLPMRLTASILSIDNTCLRWKKVFLS